MALPLTKHGGDQRGAVSAFGIAAMALVDGADTVGAPLVKLVVDPFEHALAVDLSGGFKVSDKGVDVDAAEEDDRLSGADPDLFVGEGAVEVGCTLRVEALFPGVLDAASNLRDARDFGHALAADQGQ